MQIFNLILEAMAVAMEDSKKCGLLHFRSVEPRVEEFFYERSFASAVVIIGASCIDEEYNQENDTGYAEMQYRIYLIDYSKIYRYKACNCCEAREDPWGGDSTVEFSYEHITYRPSIWKHEGDKAIRFDRRNESENGEWEKICDIPTPDQEEVTYE